MNSGMANPAAPPAKSLASSRSSFDLLHQQGRIHDIGDHVHNFRLGRLHLGKERPEVDRTGLIFFFQ